MINNVYQLVGTKTLVVKFEDISLGGRVLVRPSHMAICHADQRYYLGQRDHSVLQQKLPMAPIHEAMGTVLFDPTGTYRVGQHVVMIPNIPGQESSGVFENYASGSGFLSSGYDGFMRELVDLAVDRVISCEGIDPTVAAITEFVSVAFHASTRFDTVTHDRRKCIAIFGDGSLAYVTACVLSKRFPEVRIVVMGRHAEKLALFSFVDKTYFSDALPADLVFDHAFECTGGEGSAAAIDTIIKHIAPQGTVLLMGVSERPVPVFTRNVLEKGLTLIGCSRSGRTDFEGALALMADGETERRLKQIIYVDDPVYSVADIKRVFATDLVTPFKTVFEWRL